MNQPQSLDYLSHPKARVRRMISGRVLAIGGSLLLVGLMVGVRAYNYQRERRNDRVAAEEMACRAQLREIYTALQAYGIRNNGAYPDALDTLTKQQLVTPVGGRTASEMLRCPVGQPYQYLGKGFTVASQGRRPIVVEPAPAHGRGGRHILYEDGAIDTLGW